MAEHQNQKRRYRSTSMANATCEHKLLWEDCPQCAEFTPNADAILGFDPTDHEERYPEWMERSPETGETA